MGNPPPTPTVPPPAEATMMNNINNENNDNNEDPEKSVVIEHPTEIKAAKKSAAPNWVNQGTNLVLIICISAMTLCLRSDMISVTRRGFYCDDMSIRYPVRPQTISTKVLIVASILLAGLLFSVTEYFILKQHKFLTTTTVLLFKKSLQIPAWLGPSLRLLLTYFMGAAANSILTDIAKNVIGWPRPNFWETCQPNVTCSNEAYRYVYITSFKCLAATEEELEDALKSFPSAHASLMAYVAFFIVLYVHERFKAFNSIKSTLRPFIQLIVLGLCWWSALTRVKDYVHHPIDVLAGLLIGSGVALWSWPFMNELLLDIDETHKTKKYNMN